jgi:hypothetical protein
MEKFILLSKHQLARELGVDVRSKTVQGIEPNAYLRQGTKLLPLYLTRREVKPLKEIQIIK